MEFQEQALSNNLIQRNTISNNCTSKIGFWLIFAVWLVFIFINPVTAKDSDVREYGIVILPEDKCTKKAEEINADITKLLSHLKNAENYWHVTLYHGAYEEKDLPEIYKKLQRLTIKPFSLNFSKISSTSDRWIDLGTEKTEYLQQLHTSILNLASPYHKRPLKRAADVYRDVSADKQKQIDTYGVSSVLESYNPHMTLFYQYPPTTELREAAQKISAKFGDPLVCKASKIILGELGYNGNIKNVVYSVDIPN